ncbi:hypothetical protein ACSZOP_07135 [Colibacter massiliensis]|uniref:hypothetical protein n=1 Tax=Colibacter massiliensis TaxID=1852379 RepID=UPI003F8DD77B
MIKAIFVRSIMFISSYFPLYILLLISQGDLLLPFGNTTQKLTWYSGSFIVALGILIVISLISILLLKNAPIGSYCNPVNMKRPDDKVMNYVFIYIIPILGLSFNDFHSVIVNVLLFLMIWFLYIKLDLIFVNPLWSLFGYISYEYDGGYIITDIRYEDVVRTKTPLLGCYLTNRIFLARKGKRCGA